MVGSAKQLKIGLVASLFRITMLHLIGSVVINWVSNFQMHHSKQLRACLVSASIFLAGGPSMAGTYEDAAAAHRRGEHAKAVAILAPLAESGDARSQAALGFSYAIGEGVERNPVVAVKWYRLAADQGDAFAQSNLGASYGEGTEYPIGVDDAPESPKLAE
jgi:TPR repeat protein